MPEAARALILASGSRFRRKMLENAGVSFSVVAADVDEPAARAQMMHEAPHMLPADVALRLAELKALDVSAQHRDVLIIGADQVLALEGQIFGKPADEPAAREQLRQLRGRTHTLPTAVVLARNGAIVWRHVSIAELDMRSFSDEFLEAYLAAAGGILTETVGGYALEGLGAQLFSRIAGDYFTIIGLPLMPLLAELRARGELLV
jgi:septum formation protein